MTRSGDRRCFYAILSVSKSASPSEIKKAYYNKALQLHPDQAKDEASKLEYLKVAEAFEVLSCPKKRPLYDSLHATEWHPPEQEDRRERREHKSGPPTAAELLLGPRSLGLVLVALVLSVFFSPQKKKTTDGFVDACWRNPATGRWEPPAPWDPAYKAATKKRLRRSQLR